MSKDAVYPLGPDRTDELRYSLRTLHNLPGVGRVFIMSATPPPEWTKNVEWIETPDLPKWESMHHKFVQMCQTKELSKEIYLMEDDYYILRPIRFLPNYSYGTIAAAEKRRGILPNDNWLKSLLATRDVLVKAGVKNPINYETHVPIVINRAKAPLWLDDGKPLRWHSAYGNMVKSRETRDMAFDVKAMDNDALVSLLRLNTTFLSSIETTFVVDRVAEALNYLFPEKSRYER